MKKKQNKKSFWRSPKFRRGGLATLFTVGFIAIVLLLNIVVSAVNTRFPLTVDMTAAGAFTLSDETADYLKSVDEPVEIDLCSSENVYATSSELTLRIHEALDQISALNQNIKVSYIDLTANPSFAQNYPDETLTESSIIVKSDLRYRVFQYSDLFETSTNDYGYTTIESDRIEQVLMSKVLSVTAEESPVFTILDNSMGMDLDSFQTLLTDNGYEIRTCDLITGAIDPDTDFVVIPSATRDYSEEELEKLDAYLANTEKNVNLLVLFDAQQPELPNLNAFLAEWGIQPENTVICESDSGRYVTDQPGYCVVDYSEGDLAGQFRGNEDQLFIYNCRVMRTLFDEQGSIRTAPLLETADTGLEMAVDESGNVTEVGSGVLYPAVMSVKTNGEHQATVVALGTSLFFHDTLLSYGNDSYSMSLFNTLCGREDTVSIPSRAVGVPAIQLSEAQAVTIGLIIFTIALPLLILAGGLVLWLRRRQL